jgi:hypothetical protein
VDSVINEGVAIGFRSSAAHSKGRTKRLAFLFSRLRCIGPLRRPAADGSGNQSITISAFQAGQSGVTQRRFGASELNFYEAALKSGEKIFAVAPMIDGTD